MTREQIETAAQSYCDEDRVTRSEYLAFIAGAESRQAEIDELKQAVELAEQDARERAIETFNKWVINIGSKYKIYADSINDFIKIYDND